MCRKLLKAKIHRVVVTEADLHYESSLTVDKDSLDAADIREHEMEQVVDIGNGARFETYTYIYIPESELAHWQPKIILMNDDNTIKKRSCSHIVKRKRKSSAK